MWARLNLISFAIMYYLIACILFNVGIFLCFRQFKVFNINTFQAIVFNYITCVLTGFIFTGNLSVFTYISEGSTWIYIALFLGFIFIFTFYLMALTTQRFSMTVSSIASKMSLIIPVLISLFILNIASKEYTFLNYIGMGLAFPAIIFSSIKPKNTASIGIVKRGIILPLAVFILGGCIDATINFTNHHYLTETTEPIFPIAIFFSASIIGIIMISVRRNPFHRKNLFGGIALGIINYFSIYFLIKALGALNNDGAVVYPLLNVGIIILSAVISYFIFKERFSTINKVGLILAILSIIFISLS